MIYGYAIGATLPHLRSGFGGLLWEFLGFWVEVDSGVAGLVTHVPSPIKGRCARLLGVA